MVSYFENLTWSLIFSEWDVIRVLSLKDLSQIVIVYHFFPCSIRENFSFHFNVDM